MPAPNPATMEVGRLAIDPVRLDGTGARIGPRLYTLSSDGQVAEFLPAVGTVAPIVAPVYAVTALNTANLEDGALYEYSGPTTTVNLLTTLTFQEVSIFTTTNAITFTGDIVTTGSGGPILPGGCIMSIKKLSAGNYLLYGDMTT